MCGIAGNLDSKHGIDANALRRMAAALQHRGQDDTGVWVDKNPGIGLAHRRLAVVD
jgi:asparagine synthase (glutamine-hydrolysing)